jgi:hypothetical protein
MKTSLPEDSAERKGIPMDGGCLEYFPAALAGVALHSRLGNDKHNPGQPLHHARGKSSDHGDCVVRHKMDISAMLKTLRALKANNVRIDAKDIETLLTEANALSWRALALSQEIHEEFGDAPLAPNARFPEPVTSNQKPVLVVGARIRIKCGVDDPITGTVVSIHPTGTDNSLLRVDPEFSEQVWQASEGTGELKAGEYGWFFSEKDVLQILS